MSTILDKACDFFNELSKIEPASNNNFRVTIKPEYDHFLVTKGHATVSTDRIADRACTTAAIVSSYLVGKFTDLMRTVKIVMNGEKQSRLQRINDVFYGFTAELRSIEDAIGDVGDIVLYAKVLFINEARSDYVARGLISMYHALDRIVEFNHIYDATDDLDNDLHAQALCFDLIDKINLDAVDLSIMEGARGVFTDLTEKSDKA